MTNLEKDIDKLLYDMKKHEALDKYNSYIMIKKNIIFSSDENILIQNQKKDYLEEQNKKESIIENELLLFDTFNIPFIGMKGPFLKTEYYGTIPRVYNDLDLLVESKNANSFYRLLLKNGYRIKKKTYYDGPSVFMNLIPETYMNNTQTLMLINKEKNVSIDLHSNLNITNAHFRNTSTNFSTQDLFNNSAAYLSYNNIRQFELYDNLCFNIRHLLKHHIFYGKTQTGFRTMLQHLVDIAVLFNSENFSENNFIAKVVKYNIVPEALFCVSLYNKVFKSLKRVDELELKALLKTQVNDFYWRTVLDAALNMEPYDIMIGNYEKFFPREYKWVEFCQHRKNYKANWTIQALILNPIIIKRLSKKL